MAEKGQIADFIPLRDFLTERNQCEQLKNKKFFGLFQELKYFQVCAETNF